MNNSTKTPIMYKITVFLVLFYAFATRSIVGPMIFRGPVLLLYYGVMYIGLFYCFANSFIYEAGHLYASKEVFTLLLLFIVIALGLYRSGKMSSLLYYGIALLLPFALYPEMKESDKTARIFVAIGIVMVIGCMINYYLPSFYNAAILPLFSESTQQDLNWQAEFGTFFPGFTSQVGYTSFFISTATGTLFCFRKEFGRWFYPLTAILMYGMFLTGKRGPFMYLIIAMMLIYFLEGYERDRVLRVFKLMMIAVAGYFALMFLAHITGNPGITRIFEAVRSFAVTGDLEDNGRDQLREQALLYFERSPIIGIGWNNFKNLFTLRSTHVHNIYVQLLCETGLIGTAIFILFFGKNLIAAIKKMKISESQKLDYPWSKFSLFMQAYFLLYGLSGNPLYDIEETILYFFAVGIIMLPVSLKESEVKT